MKFNHSFYEIGLIILFTSIYIIFIHEIHALELGIETKFEGSDPRSFFFFFDTTYVVTRGIGTRKEIKARKPGKIQAFLV